MATISLNASIRLSARYSNSSRNNATLERFYDLVLRNGKGSNQIDTLYYWENLSISSASPVSFDIFSGVLPDFFNVPIQLAELTCCYIHNNSTTLGEYVTLGAGSTPIFTNMFNSNAAKIKVQPSADWFWCAPTDGTGATVTTGQTKITLTTPSATNVHINLLYGGKGA